MRELAFFAFCSQAVPMYGKVRKMQNSIPFLEVCQRVEMYNLDFFYTLRRRIFPSSYFFMRSKIYLPAFFCFMYYNFCFYIKFCQSVCKIQAFFLKNGLFS